GIWEGTATVNGVNGGNFVFFNSPNGSADWGTKEDLTGLSCADPGNFNDRIMPTFTQDTTLLFCFGSCETDGTCSTPPPPPVGGNVTFSVDMSNYTGSFTTVNVNGDFNGWCGTCNPLTDMGSGIWEVTLPLTADSIDYKFTVDGWNDQESFAGGESCTKTKGGFTNRYLRILGDTAVGTVCWNSCSVCTPPSTGGNVTLSVNMNAECAYDSVSVSGDFNSWGATAMTDMGGGIFSATVAMSAGSNDYKFSKYVSGSAVMESISNRNLNVTGDTTLSAVCFNNVANCSGGFGIDSVQTINVAQGVYRVHLNGPLPAATSYTVEWKPDTASVYRSKTFT
ncbi:MAG: hypothetical protein EBT52_09160, partial [Flavobacteriia bacterium]|nr:hypothetical protein [Flavobacteriia bacterium]